MSHSNAGSGPGGGHVDWDLLADHLGGALADTPAQAEVAHLIATDPHWARAADALAVALAAVDVDLRALPPVPPLPDSVAVHLDTVVRELPAPAPAHTAPAPAAGTPRPQDRRPPARPGRSGRRRRARWGTGAAVAAGLAALATVGVGSLGLLEPGGVDSSEEDTASLAEADRAQAPELADAPPMLATGTDYTPGKLGLAPAATGPAPEREAGDTAADGAEPETFTVKEVPDALVRVHADPDPCLAAVLATHEPGPAEVRKVDFAYFEEEAAVVIWLTTADDTEWVSVAGSECGTSTAGADELHRTQVG